MSIKKTPIGQIGNSIHKVTIADEIELETQFHIEPSLSPKELAFCWLDPSEVDEAKRPVWKIVTSNHREAVTLDLVELLKIWLKPEALERKIFTFESDTHFQWAQVKRRVLKKYNLTGLGFNSMATQVHSLTISSREPLYDTDAHPNRVRNVLRAVKVHYPHVHFENEGCKTSGQCPIGLQDALRKLALEAHGKKVE